MPLKISKTAKILKTLNRFQTIEFNTTLPVKLEVKEKLNDIKYLIQLGKKEVITKSFIPLKKGKYFAIIKELHGNIQISNLQKLSNIALMFERITPKEVNTKEQILHHLANASNKEEFIFYMNILFSFERKIYHLFINEEKKALFQYKFHKNKLQFYAVFNNLGEIEGEIFNQTLNIFSPFKNTIKLIKQNSNLINLKVNTFLKNVKPLYEFSENLINLKA